MPEFDPGNTRDLKEDRANTPQKYGYVPPFPAAARQGPMWVSVTLPVPLTMGGGGYVPLYELV